MKKQNIPDKCPICKSPLLKPALPIGSTILLLGEHPGPHETQTGIPFTGPNGVVLRKEVAALGIDYTELSVANVWWHEPKEECQECHGLLTIKLLHPMRRILCLGSEASTLLLGMNATAMAGMWLKSRFAPLAWVMTTWNPAAVMRSTSGEFRLDLERFFNGPRARKETVWQNEKRLFLKRLSCSFQLSPGKTKSARS